MVAQGRPGAHQAGCGAVVPGLVLEVRRAAVPLLVALGWAGSVPEANMEWRYLLPLPGNVGALLGVMWVRPARLELELALALALALTMEQSACLAPPGVLVVVVVVVQAALAEDGERWC